MKKYIRFLSLILCLTLCLSACGNAPVTNPTETAESTEPVLPAGMVKDIAYIDDGSKYHMLDLHGIEEGVTKPVIVQIHGGGLVSGDKSGDTKYSEYLRDFGFAVVNVNYTLLPDGDIKTVVQDMIAILDWIAENGATYGLDAQNVILNGESAGGYISALMASVLTDETVRTYYEVDWPAVQVKAYGMSCPMTKLDTLCDLTELKNADGVSVADILSDPEVLRMADLTQSIDPETYPEVYMITTEGDTDWYAGAAQWHGILEINGVEHQYVKCEPIEHHLIHVFNVTYLNWEESKVANEALLEYFREMLE